jgi:hypothetical protein
VKKEKKKFSFELLLEGAGGKIGHLAGALCTTSFAVIYRLKEPETYGWPAGVFDLRSDLPNRLAKIAGTTPGSVREYYMRRWEKSGAKQKEEV